MFSIAKKETIWETGLVKMKSKNTVTESIQNVQYVQKVPFKPLHFVCSVQNILGERTLGT